jgi:Flp pilus assembly protein TadD
MERALRAYQHAHACDEEDWRPWHRMGLMHEKKGDRRAACVAFRNAAREAPQNFRPLRALARVLQQLEKKEEAQEVFAEAQRLSAEEKTQSQH